MYFCILYFKYICKKVFYKVSEILFTIVFCILYLNTFEMYFTQHWLQCNVSVPDRGCTTSESAVGEMCSRSRSVKCYNMVAKRINKHKKEINKKILKSINLLR